MLASSATYLIHVGQKRSFTHDLFLLMSRLRSRGRLLHFKLCHCGPQQLVESDWQLAHAMTCRVKDGIGDCSRDTDNTWLSQAFRAERIDNRIALVDEDHIDIMHVRIDRHVILREIVVDESS